MTPRILAALEEMRDALGEIGASTVDVGAHFPRDAETPDALANVPLREGSIVCYGDGRGSDTVLRTYEMHIAGARVVVINVRTATPAECSESAHKIGCLHHWSRRPEIANVVGGDAVGSGK